MSAFLQDVRYALRQFAKRPGMTAIAVLSLAIASGPNAALFSAINTLFLRDLMVQDCGALAGIEATTGRGITYPDYAEIAAQTNALSHVVAWIRRPAPISIEGYEEVTPANVVSANYFAGLGVRPVRGRVLAPELDETLSSEPSVVISYSLWQRRFGGRADVVGQVFQVNTRNAVVAGVAPADFRGMDFQMPSDIWVPFSAMETLRMGRRAWLDSRERGQFEIVVGRLRPGVSLEQARVELDGIGQRLAQAYPGTNKDRKFQAFSLRAKRAYVALVVGGIVLGLVTLVLLVACGNVAGLLLAQAEERRKEVAMRLALGASRWRLLRQFLTESVLLALLGAGGGLLLGFWLLRLPLKPPMLASFDYGIRLNAGVFVYTLGLAVVTAILFGLVPALKASKYDFVTALKSERGAAPRRWRWLSARNVLVVSQVAISQFLLAGTALCLRSYMNVSTVPMGFDPNRNVLFAHLAPSGELAAQRRPAGMENMVERVRGIPGVLDVSGASHIPLSGSGGGTVQKVALPGESEEVSVGNNFVAPGFFAVMGTRLLRGRDFERHDTAATARTVIVNEALARRVAPAGDAAGRWLRVEGIDREIIGVVENGRYRHLREPEQPYLYLPSAGPSILAISVAEDSPALAEAVRKRVAAATPQLRVINCATLSQTMRFATYVDAVAAGLFGVLGLLGMFLAAIGLYGVVAHAVTRRTQEIGVRLALGADARSISRMILGEGAALTLVGAAFGLAGAIAGGIVMRSVLFGFRPVDTLSCLGGTLAVLGIALLASHFPARRAMRIDPAVSLRAE